MRTVNEDFVSRTLEEAERAVMSGLSLKGTGFWRAVSLLRRDPEAAARYAEIVGRIDRRAFEQGVSLRVPAWLGVAVLTGGTAAGAVVVALFDHPLWFLAGTGALIVSSHSLAHWIVGRLLGIRFTHVFMGGPPPPRPGVKTDYATYLRTKPRRRAVMHASGAVVTKLIPFALLPLAPARWIFWLLVGIGIVQIVTDVLFSTKSSDWMKVRRELRAASR